MRAIADSPSGGEFEILDALRRSHTRTGHRTVTPARVKRHFPKRTTVSEVTTLLDAQSGTNVSSGGGTYALTDAGYTRARSNPPRRWVSLT